MTNCQTQHCEYEPECAFRQSGGRMDILDGDCPFYDEVSRMNTGDRKRYFEGVYQMAIVSHYGFNRQSVGIPELERGE